MAEKPEAVMRKLGISTCGECKLLKDLRCTRTPLEFPALKSDPCCGKFVSRRG